jgi:hypothetical protein
VVVIPKRLLIDMAMHVPACAAASDYCYNYLYLYCLLIFCPSPRGYSTIGPMGRSDTLPEGSAGQPVTYLHSGPVGSETPGGNSKVGGIAVDIAAAGYQGGVAAEHLESIVKIVEAAPYPTP